MCSEPNTNHSNSKAYEDKLSLAVKQGTGVFALLQPQPGERILDLGCGTGDFMAKIAAAGAIPTGIDLSEEMVMKARQKYPELNIQVEDASQYRTDVCYDAVFSHAAIHWMKDPEAVVLSIWLALRAGGRLVAEFAGSGNVAVLTEAIQETLEAYGYAWAGRNPWYFPTIGEYTRLLEQTGFRVKLAQHLEMPTPLKGEAPVQNWLNGFDKHFFHDVTPTDKASIYQAIETKVNPDLYRGGQWTADTCRLRIVAIKEPA